MNRDRDRNGAEPACDVTVVNKTRSALASALVGASLALGVSACSVETPVPAAAAAPVPAPVVAAPVVASPTTARKANTDKTGMTEKKATPAKKKGKTAAECARIGNGSSLSNADLYPYLRSIGCGRFLDSAIEDAEEQNGGPGAHSSGYDQNGDGVYNGYERCGTSCGEEPTSGESQYEWGCKQGYITEGC